MLQYRCSNRLPTGIRRKATLRRRACTMPALSLLTVIYQDLEQPIGMPVTLRTGFLAL
jgi:hypothetical protein